MREGRVCAERRTTDRKMLLGKCLPYAFLDLLSGLLDDLGCEPVQSSQFIVFAISAVPTSADILLGYMQWYCRGITYSPQALSMGPFLSIGSSEKSGIVLEAIVNSGSIRLIDLDLEQQQTRQRCRRYNQKSCVNDLA